MSMQFWKTTALSLATILVVYIFLIGVSMGADLNHANYRFKDDHQVPDNYLAQVTSVSELKDVDPAFGYYEAIKSLVEKYGCSVGYPDRTFRPGRTIMRVEVASTTRACMDQVGRLTQGNIALLREDIEKSKNFLAEIINQYPSKRR